MKNKKRIGILGGISYESTIKYYSIIHTEYYRKFNNYDYPEIVIFSLNFGKVIDLEYSNDREAYINYLLEGINSLESAGVDVILMAANSVHSIYKELNELSKIPILSIVKTTAEEAMKLNLKKLLLLGIKLTMNSEFYMDYFNKLNIDIITPNRKERDQIEEIIFQELVKGEFKIESKKQLLRIIGDYNIDGVILGCTELPLIIHQEDLDVQVLNTLKLHALAGLNYAIGEI
ncbi:MAG: amino acid racemase [Candidatus Lokiarchaeota archaeon]